MNVTTPFSTRVVGRVALCAAVALSVIGVIAAVVAVGGSTAEAASNKVDYVNFSPAYETCNPGQALPCPSGAGHGDSGQFFVTQSEVAEGVWAFDGVETNSFDDDHLWVAANYGGKCKVGSRLGWSSIDTGWSTYSAVNYSPSSVSGEVEWYHPISVNENNRTQAHRVEQVHVPIDELFGPAGDVAGNDILFGFPTLESVFARGEAEIAQKVAEGMSESAARAQTFHVDTHVAMHGALSCSHTAFSHVSTKHTSHWVPVRITFTHNQDPEGLELDDEPTVPIPLDDGGLTVGVQVVQAHLSVDVDAEDPCRLNLSGVIVTNAPTTVEYRFVDELGVKSQVFAVEVDHTFTEFLDDYVELEPINGGGDGGGHFLPNPEADDGVIDEYATPETDREQGTYRIEIVTPHTYWSNTAGYNVEPCVEPIDDFARTDGGTVEQFEFDGVYVDPAYFGEAPMTRG